MSRILEFQPTDEQTVVARVLVELHQAIDAHFPGANPSARQFTKTVLTNQGESTRVDNVPTSAERRSAAQADIPEAQFAEQEISKLSMTPRGSQQMKMAETPLATADLKRLMGESPTSRVVTRLLIGAFVVGVAVFIALFFLGTDMRSVFG